jgi:hypothetical protein
MAKKAPAKKAPAKKQAAKTIVYEGKNLATLTGAGVIPAGYKRLTPTEKQAIEALSESEVAAIIGTKTKLGPKFFPKHAAHGMLY